MLRTYETKPQLIVKVNDYQAVCHNLTCDYKYVETAGLISSFSFTESSKLLVIEGTDLPSSMSNIEKVDFALSECIVDESTLTDTHLECTLVQEPTCGSYVPNYIAILGKIPSGD
jgi:hypothetical protein